MSAANLFDVINNGIETKKLQPKTYNRPGTDDTYSVKLFDEKGHPYIINFFDNQEGSKRSRKNRYQKKGYGKKWSKKIETVK